jgi:GntR family transcriptional regulator
MDTNIKKLDIEVDLKSALPVYEQIKEKIKFLIISGYLKENDRITPIRELASKLQINQNTIVKVFYQLDVEGFLYSKRGSGYFVKSKQEKQIKEKQKMFVELTAHYAEKVIKLGFSEEVIVKEIRRKIQESEEK